MVTYCCCPPRLGSTGMRFGEAVCLFTEEAGEVGETEAPTGEKECPADLIIFAGETPQKAVPCGGLDDDAPPGGEREMGGRGGRGGRGGGGGGGTG